MPSEDISAQQSQGLADPAEMWAANYRSTQGDHDYLNKLAARQNPVAGETAPKYWNTIDPQKQWAQYNQNPYSPENLAKQQYQDSHPMSPVEYARQQAALPNTIYGKPGGTFVVSNGPGGRGGQNVGGFVQLGGSKSQGPSFDQLGSGVKYDKSKAVWDNNYGWIMPTPQEKVGQGDWIPGALQTGASLAAGAVGIPPWATGAIQAAKGYGSGESLGQIGKNILPSLIGAGLGQSGFNLPLGLSQIYNYGRQAFGAYNTFNNMRHGNYMAGLGTVLPFASQFMRG